MKCVLVLPAQLKNREWNREEKRSSVLDKERDPTYIEISPGLGRKGKEEKRKLRMNGL